MLDGSTANNKALLRGIELDLERRIVRVEVPQSREKASEADRSDIEDLERGISFGIFFVDFLDELSDLFMFVGIGFDEDGARKLIDDDDGLRIHRHDRFPRDGELRILETIDARRHSVVMICVDLLDEFGDLFMFRRFRQNDHLVGVRSNADLHVRIERKKEAGKLRIRQSFDGIGDHFLLSGVTLLQEFFDDFAESLLRGGTRVENDESRRGGREDDRRGIDALNVPDKKGMRRGGNIAQVVRDWHKFHIGIAHVETLNKALNFGLDIRRGLAHQFAGARGPEDRLTNKARLAEGKDIGNVQVDHRILSEN